MIEMNKTYCGDALEVLKTFPDNFIDCCVTPPPYWGLRDYGVEGQLGLESTPEEYVSKMVEVFTEVKRVLKPTGTLWLNLGDSYASDSKGSGGISSSTLNAKYDEVGNLSGKSQPHFETRKVKHGLKTKDLIGIPWMVAFALRNSGWWLRQDIIWHKPNPMPESVTDRCTKAHEYIFLLSKSAKYYYDAEAIKEESKDISIARMARGVSDNHKNINGAPGQTPHSIMQPRQNRKYQDQSVIGKKLSGHSGGFYSDGSIVGAGMANKRSVWTVTTKPTTEAHFATFPPELIVDCIKAGCPEDGIVLDPFNGSGTTRLVAEKLGRNSIGIELNPKYIQIENRRRKKELGMFEKIAS